MEKYSAVFPDMEIPTEPVTDKKVQMAWQLFVSLEYQVQVADRKVQAVFGLNAFLVAALSLQSQQPLHEIIASGINFSLALDLLLKACFLSCVCVATWSAIRALSPRFKTETHGATVRRSSLFFFGDIQSKSPDDFTSSFMGLSNSDAVHQVLFQSQVISKILSTKYKFLRRSTIFLSAALMIWILLEINKFLS
jgi:hypothetical protein